MSTVRVEPSYIAVEVTTNSPVAAVRCAHEKLAVVIPTLREVECLESLLGQIRTELDRLELCYEILVVDDDSRDGTEELVNSISGDDPRVRLLVRRGERGLSGAILHGWQNTDATILGVMDADCQHPPELLPRLLEPMVSGCDLAIGSRYAHGGEIGAWNPIRRLISALAVWVTWPIQHRTIRAKDPMSGFFFVRRRCVENVLFQSTGFKLLLEILVRGHIRSVEEVPFTFGNRSAGRSKANLKVARDYFVLLTRLYLARMWPQRRLQPSGGD